MAMGYILLEAGLKARQIKINSNNSSIKTEAGALYNIRKYIF